MDVRMPEAVTQVMSEYISLINEHLPNALEGVYIHGSIALDAYHSRLSDIDFITIMNRQLSDTDISTLSKIHEKIASSSNKPELDGCYLQWADLGTQQNEDRTHPIYNIGKISTGNYNHPVTWWVLKKRGITLLGPEPTTLNFEVHEQQLVEYVHENMNTYWADYIKKMESQQHELHHYPDHVVDQAIAWSVLGMLRQYYTIKEREIISKVGSGEYGLRHLPEEWHTIIRESIRIRTGSEERFYDNNEKRISDTLDCLKYILSYCNNRATSI